MSEITIDSIIKGVEEGPITLTLLGKEAVGKTHFACQAPGVVLMDLEHGAEMYDVQKIPLYGKDITFENCMEALRLIYSNHKKLDAKTVVVDSMDWVQNLIDQEVCRIKEVQTVEELSWGVGFQVAASLAQDFINGLDALRHLGLDIIVICHTAIVKVDEPILDMYEVYDCKLHRKIGSILKEWSTVLAFCEFETRTHQVGEKFGRKMYKAVSSGNRIMHTVPQAGFVAKSRIPIPSPLPFDWKVFKDEINKSRKGE